MTFEPGSSPHVRGARYYNHAEGGVAGIIPACAGSTIFVIPSYLPSRDHPRMCGEHNMFSQPIPYEKGSSPHVRGAR